MFTFFAHRIVLGRLFQSFGAAHVNERSPRVVRLLNTGYFTGGPDVVCDLHTWQYCVMFEPFKRMYENGSKIALNSTCSKGFK